MASRRRFQRVTAYVTQEDVFHPTSTVKEVVLFHAHLRCVVGWCMYVCMVGLWGRSSRCARPFVPTQPRPFANGLYPMPPKIQPPTQTRLDRRVPAREKEERVLELIEDVGLDGKEDQRVGVRRVYCICMYMYIYMLCMHYACRCGAF